MAESSASQQSNQLLEEIARHLHDNDIPAALAIAEREYAVRPSVELVCALSAIAFRQGNIAAAIRLLEPLCEEVQGSSDLPEALAVLNCLAGRVGEALYYGKLATVHQVDGSLLPLYGAGFPRYVDAFLNIDHKPLLTRARRFFDDGLYPDAIHLMEQHLQLFRDDVEGLDHYAQCLSAAGEYRKAVSILRSVLTLGGPSATLLSRLGQALVAQGDFDQGMACHRQAVTRGAKAAVLWAAMVRDWAYHPWQGGTEANDAVAGLINVIRNGGPKVPRKAPAAQVRPSLVVGIVCNAPHDAEQRAMIAAVAGGFDRTRVKVVGFGPGELDAAVNNIYRGGFSVWRNTHKVDELTLSALIRGEGVDVLIDADGFAARERLSLLLRNSAPLQYSWLNVPAGIAVPGAHGNLGAGIEGLPGFLLAVNSAEPSALPAASAPGGAVTFGADVSMAELNVEVARVWSAILLAVPESTLVLADRGFRTADNTNRLVEMFGNFGVAHRIDVISADPAEFFANVDIALAPFPVLRPDPYGTALLAGVPLVALGGRDSTGFARALRLLGDAGQRMVADTVEDYVGLARDLAADRDNLAAVRQSMPAQFRQTALFSPTAFAAAWEGLFRDRLAALAAAGETV